MNHISKKTSLIILAITALVCSRAMFALFNDPEGPNLLIVVVAAAVLWGLSYAKYSYSASASGKKKLLLAVATQVIVAAVATFFLK